MPPETGNAKKHRRGSNVGIDIRPSEQVSSPPDNPSGAVEPGVQHGDGQDGKRSVDTLNLFLVYVSENISPVIAETFFNEGDWKRFYKWGQMVAEFKIAEVKSNIKNPPGYAVKDYLEIAEEIND